MITDTSKNFSWGYYPKGLFIKLIEKVALRTKHQQVEHLQHAV